MSMNPFTFGNPIRDPARFYGREEDIRQILNRLLSSAHESTSVVGERRIGKTSLLKHLSNPEVALQYGLTPDQYCLVYIDFQGLTDITPQRFWERVLRKMRRASSNEKLKTLIEETLALENIDLFDLEDLFEAFHDLDMNVILFMDEFEYITQNTNFGSDFFGGLRALAIHYSLTLITATRRELVDLCHSEEIKGSPFFNIFATVILRPFSPEVVNELIKGYMRDTELVLGPEDYNFVLKLGGGYPFFVQMIGHYLYEGKNRGLVDKELFAYTLEEFNNQAEAHFTYIWSHTSESERITLLSIMALSRQKASKKSATTLENLRAVYSRAHLDIADLSKRGVVIKPNDEYILFSPSLDQWISMEVSAMPGGAEDDVSVEQWLKAGNDEKLTPVKGVLPKFKKKYWPIMSTVAQQLSIEFAQSLAVEFLMNSFL